MRKMNLENGNMHRKVIKKGGISYIWEEEEPDIAAPITGWGEALGTHNCQRGFLYPLHAEYPTDLSAI